MPRPTFQVFVKDVPHLAHSDQVRGFCKDLSNPELFDAVNVYGNIYDSDIHHLNFGVYTYGHQQGDWRRNKMHDNTAYGFDPHDDSDFLTSTTTRSTTTVTTASSPLNAVTECPFRYLRVKKKIKDIRMLMVSIRMTSVCILC